MYLLLVIWGIIKTDGLKIPYKKINALRVQVPNGNEDVKNVIEAALVPNGFSLEAIREKEYCGNQDIYVYCARIVRND